MGETHRFHNEIAMATSTPDEAVELAMQKTAQASAGASLKGAKGTACQIRHASAMAQRASRKDIAATLQAGALQRGDSGADLVIAQHPRFTNLQHAPGGCPTVRFTFPVSDMATDMLSKMMSHPRKNADTLAGFDNSWMNKHVCLSHGDCRLILGAAPPAGSACWAAVMCTCSGDGVNVKGMKVSWTTQLLTKHCKPHSTWMSRM